MRVIKSDTGFLFYEKIFKQMMANQSNILVWQVSPEDGSRQVSNSLLNSYHIDSRTITLDVKQKDLVNPFLPLYCYVVDGPMIFKTDIQEVGLSVSAALPIEIQILDQEQVSVMRTSMGSNVLDSGLWISKRPLSIPEDAGLDIMRVKSLKSMSERSSRDQDLLNNEFGLSVDEEDKKFAGQRESPRARPKDQKHVKVARLSNNGHETYKLFDLSRGGMGFVIPEEHLFPKGSEVHILGFNDFDLDDPLVGIVMSIRPLDETTEFKIGVKFSEGQD